MAALVAVAVVALGAVVAPPANAAPGDLDPSFGSGGTLTTPFGSGIDGAAAVAIQADRKIVAAGSRDNGSDYDFALARYTSAGALDTSFGTGGKVSTFFGSANDEAYAVAIQSDGKIVAAGYSNNGSNDDFALARYTSAGALDGSFGSLGKISTDFAADTDVATAVALQSDGRIVAAGRSFIGGGYDFALARYTSAGALDTSFGTGGKVTTPIGSSDDTANAVAIQADGKIVAAGSSLIGSTLDFALARYMSAGALDTSFGTGGTVTTPVGSFSNFALDVALQADGKIVAAGSSSNGSNDDFALARYTSAGALDTSFGTGGKVTTPIGSSDDNAAAVAIQSDGKIVAAGLSSVIGSDFDFALARYLTDTPALSIADATLTEGDAGSTNLTFTVSVALAGARSPQDITVHYATAEGSAMAPEDFTAKSGSVTFFVGQTSKTVTVPIKGDLIDEPAESFFVNLSNPQGAVIDNGTATGTINDNDPTPALSVSDVSVTEGDSGTTYAVFTISLSNPSSQTIAVDYETADGGATAPADYTAKSGTKVFPAGVTARTVSVAVKGETTQEPDEKFFLNLLDPLNATIDDGQGQAIITDDDRPTISINDVTRTEGNSGTTQSYVFTVSLNHAGTSTITVHYATADGTAVAPGDYTAKSGTLTFSVGQVSKTVSVTVKGDNTVEPNEVFSVNLDSATNATIADAQGLGTIVNND